MCPRADASIGPHRVNVFSIISHHPSAGQIYTPVPVCFFQKRRLTKHLSVDILGVQTAMLCKVYGIGQRKKGGDRYETLPALQFAYHPARPQDLPGLRQEGRQDGCLGHRVLSEVSEPKTAQAKSPSSVDEGLFCANRETFSADRTVCAAVIRYRLQSCRSGSRRLYS